MDDTNKMEMDRVIAKIQKLLARTKSGRGASEAEADTAMRLAQDLMAKYNLDMAVIEAAQAKDGASTSVERVKENIKGKAMYKWQRTLARYVAEANFCYHLIKADSTWVPGHEEVKIIDGEREERWVSGRYKTSHSHIFVGRKANVITAQLMYQYLTQTVEDLMPIKDNAQRLSRSAMSWKEGCADRLCERLAAKRQDLIREHDAKVKAEEEANRAAARAHAERQPKPPPALAPNQGAEVRAAVSGMASGAHDATGSQEAPEAPERPEADVTDTWNPQDAAKQPEAPTGTALVLASVFDDAEREANYEVAWGLEPGTLAKRRAEREAREREEAEEEAKATMDKVDAPVKEETERQRQARERREAKEHMKNRRRWARESAAQAAREEREWAKKDHRMYRAGAEAGKGIGLDTQMASSTTKKLKG